MLESATAEVPDEVRRSLGDPFVTGKRSAKRWLRGHVSDPYVKEANARGYRSRAAFKLRQLDDAEHLLRRGDTVVDLGAAPGGWSQVAAERVGKGGRVLAIDRLEMAPLDGVRFVHGDFTDPALRRALLAELPAAGARLVMSDMAPNLTGVRDTDQAAAAELAREALGFAAGCLAKDGAVVVKIFQGTSMQELLAEARSLFRKVKIVKPAASRARSAESYLLGRGGIF